MVRVRAAIHLIAPVLLALGLGLVAPAAADTRLPAPVAGEDLPLRLKAIEWQDARELVSRLEAAVPPLPDGPGLYWLLAPLIIVSCISLALGLMTRRLILLNRSLQGEINRRRGLEAGLIELATTDELTRLPNRRSLLDHGAACFVAARQEARACGVILFDIDRFKAINDLHGHAGGDIVLAQVAACLRQLLPPGAMLARLGGEEFAIVLDETTADGLTGLAETLRAALEELAISHDECLIAVTASFGVAAQAQTDRHFSAMLARADAAMYRAKHAGRNLVQLDVAA